MTDEERMQKVVVDVPDDAYVGLPFEARLTGMPDRNII